MIILNLNENQNAELQYQPVWGSQDSQLKTFPGLLTHLLALYVEKERLIKVSVRGLFSYIYVLLVKLMCRAILPIEVGNNVKMEHFLNELFLEYLSWRK